MIRNELEKQLKKLKTGSIKEEHVARMGGEEECIWDIGGKARRKETTRKTNT
jgi:hypothetical protein